MITESYAKYFKIWENGAPRQVTLSLTFQVKFKVYKLQWDQYLGDKFH